MSTKTKVLYPPKRKKFTGLRGLIAEQRDFRGGSTSGAYIDAKLANELEKALDKLDAVTREYYTAETLTALLLSDKAVEAVTAVMCGSEDTGSITSARAALQAALNAVITTEES